LLVKAAAKRQVQVNAVDQAAGAEIKRSNSLTYPAFLHSEYVKVGNFTDGILLAGLFIRSFALLHRFVR